LLCEPAEIVKAFLGNGEGFFMRRGAVPATLAARLFVA